MKGLSYFEDLKEATDLKLFRSEFFFKYINRISPRIIIEPIVNNNAGVKKVIVFLPVLGFLSAIDQTLYWRLP